MLTLRATLTVLSVEPAPCFTVTTCWLVTVELAMTPWAFALPLVAKDEL